MLKEELLNHPNDKGYIPDVIAVHMNHMLEDRIRRELAEVAEELGYL